MGHAFGQRSTLSPLSSCRRGGWMPSGSRDAFTLSLLFRPGTSHGLALFHLMILICLLSYKRYFQSRNLSKIFFHKMKAKDSETSCYSGLESSAGPHDFLAVPILCHKRNCDCWSLESPGNRLRHPRPCWHLPRHLCGVPCSSGLPQMLPRDDFLDSSMTRHLFAQVLS